MNYINLSGYPLIVDGVKIQPVGRADLYATNVGGADVITCLTDECPDENTLVLVPPEIDAYDWAVAEGHAVPEGLKWNPSERAFNCTVVNPSVVEEDSGNFAFDLISKLSHSYKDIYTKAVGRLEELCAIYGMSFEDSRKVIEAFARKVGPERLIDACTDVTYVDGYFYKFFGIKSRLPVPKNAFQAKVNKEQ